MFPRPEPMSFPPELKRHPAFFLQSVLRQLRGHCTHVIEKASQVDSVIQLKQGESRMCFMKFLTEAAKGSTNEDMAWFKLALEHCHDDSGLPPSKFEINCRFSGFVDQSGLSSPDNEVQRTSSITRSMLIVPLSFAGDAVVKESKPLLIHQVLPQNKMRNWVPKDAEDVSS